jgi:hypothetical protein
MERNLAIESREREARRRIAVLFLRQDRRRALATPDLPDCELAPACLAGRSLRGAR